MEIHEEQIVKTVRYIEYRGYRFYPDKRGYWIGQVNGKRFVRLHVYVWECERGEIPKGYDVHHIDLNPDNNEIENLQLMTEHDHHELHNSLLTAAKIEAMRLNLEENARPAAIEWHKSEVGSEWHKNHYEEVSREIWSAPVTKVCQFCGKEYETVHAKAATSRFCSNNCKAQWRRKAGLDNAEGICAVCGEKFFMNKYTPAKYCSKECRSRGISAQTTGKSKGRKNIVTDT